MIKITLTNHNVKSPIKRATVDLVNKICAIDDDRHVTLLDLLNIKDFSHPLLTESGLCSADTSQTLFKYEYHNLDELFRSAILVYSTLLHVNHPKACRFILTPAADFPNQQIKHEIYFSIYPHKAAQKTIPVKQLEGIITEQTQKPFQFSNQFIIDDELTIRDFPDLIDGDKLYETDSSMLEHLRCPPENVDLELRYIHEKVGLGVFTRKLIRTGEPISFYSGIKKQHHLATLNYAFNKKNDSLNLLLDAHASGNICRFINHAPNPAQSATTKKYRLKLLEANIESKLHNIHGLDVVMFSAISDIQAGQQLLIDYGSNYFSKVHIQRFNCNNRIYRPIQAYLTNQNHSLRLMRILANQGIPDAKVYLFLRMGMIIGFIAISMQLLQRL